MKSKLSSAEADSAEVFVPAGILAPDYPANSLAGEFLLRDPFSGESLSGESLSGESLSGESLSGESLSGESLSGASFAGDLLPGDLSRLRGFDFRCLRLRFRFVRFYPV
ncbi:MAG: hypothetical protein V8Q35_11310 [Alistipes finegoldii]